MLLIAILFICFLPPISAGEINLSDYNLPEGTLKAKTQFVFSDWSAEGEPLVNATAHLDLMLYPEHPRELKTSESLQVSIIIAEHKWCQSIQDALDDNQSLIKYYGLPLAHVIRPFLKEVVYFKQKKISPLANYTNPEVLKELVSVEKEGLYSVVFYYEELRGAQLAESPPQLKYRNDEPLADDGGRNLRESARDTGSGWRRKPTSSRRRASTVSATGMTIQGKIVFRNTSGYLSAEYFDLLFFYELCSVFFTILLLSSLINRRQFSNLTRAHHMLDFLVILSCVECIFACLYWYKTNEQASKREHWSWAIVMICEISRATLARVFLLCYTLGLT